MAKKPCHHFMFTMYLATLLLWCSSLTVSCRLNSQNTNMAEVKTDGGYQSTFEELPGYFVELMASQFEINSRADETDSAPAPPAQTTAKTPSTDALLSCSGTHIGSGFILTAAHCIDDWVCDLTAHNRDHAVGHTPITGDIKSKLSRIRLKYNHMVSGAKQPAIQSGSAIEAVVFHHGYFELLPDRPTPITRARYDLALIKTSGLDFADAANLPALSEHHLSAAQLSGKTLLVYGASRENAAFVSRQLSTLGIPYIQPTNLHHLGPKHYFWGKITATTLDLQRRIDSYTDKLVHMSPDHAESLKRYLEPQMKLSNGKTEPPILHSCINNYAYPPTFKHESRTIAYPQKLYSALKELEKPIADRNPQILQPLGEHVITLRPRKYGLYPASTNPPMVVTEVMPDHTSGRINGLCNGDSGGPLIDQQNQAIVGVSSFVKFAEPTTRIRHHQLGSRCGEPKHMYFTSTYHYLNWINAAKASILNGHHQLPTYNQTSSSSTLLDNDLDP